MHFWFVAADLASFSPSNLHEVSPGYFILISKMLRASRLAFSNKAILCDPYKDQLISTTLARVPGENQ